MLFIITGITTAVATDKTNQKNVLYIFGLNVLNNALKSVYSSYFYVNKVFLNYSYKNYDLSFLDNG